MRANLKEKGRKLATLMLAALMVLGSSMPGMQAFAENGGSKLSATDIKTYSFDIIDGTHGGAKIDYKTQGGSGYNDYLNNPSKFNQPVGKDQKESELSLKFNFTYKGEVKAGDTLEIPVSLGDEFAAASFPNTTLRDSSGKEIGSYIYNSGKFKIEFSKDLEGQTVTATLNAGAVKFSNTKLGTGTNGEKAAIYGKVMGSTIVAGYEKKNKENSIGPGALSLDNVTIKSFKIIDVANGNKEIDYRTSDTSDYATFKKDSSKFSNTICENQKESRIKFKLDIDYKGTKPIIEGDTLTIPAGYNAVDQIRSFAEQPLFDATKHQIGTWRFQGSTSSFIIKFGSDYIKNNQVKEFVASLETGEMKHLNSTAGYSQVPKERTIWNGVLGRNKLVVSQEKKYITVKSINQLVDPAFGKLLSLSNDQYATWRIAIENDFFLEKTNGVAKGYYTPYMLEHDGAYNPHSLTEVYVEDTFDNGIVSEPQFFSCATWISGVNDEGKVFEGSYAIKLPMDLFKKINQGTKTKAEVKASMKDAEYCMYNNGDGSYTFMMKLFDLNDSNGFTYDKIPDIKLAGGVGNWLKKTQPDIFGNLKQTTIEKTNETFKGKAVQNLYFYFSAAYVPVKEKTQITNIAKITTKQTGEVEKKATGTLTPPAGIADAPADPLSVKLIKSDRKTGAALSKGFKFELQNTKDNGATWTKVDVKPDMLEKGSLDNGQLVPDDKGIVQIKKLAVGKYRFVETAHPEGYENVAEDKTNPNSTKNPKASNSKVIELDNQGTGEVVAMYNEPKGEKVEIKVNKKWEGPEKDSVTVKLLADGKEVPGKTLTLNKAGGWEGKFTGLDKLNVNGGEIKYDVAEVNIDGYESKKTGDAKKGFTITNKNIEKTQVKVNKVWDGPEKDSVTVKLLADGKEVPGKTLTLNKAGGWEGAFKDLPKYNKDGSEIKYDVAEVHIAFYEITKTGDAKKGFVITNKHTVPKKEVFTGSSTTNIDGEMVQPGQELTYAITYKNTTDKDVTATITDKIPAHTKFISAENGGTEAGGVVTWKPNVGKGQSITVKFKVKVDDDVNGAPLDNRAKVNDGNNEADSNEVTNPTPTDPVKEALEFGTTTKIDGKRVKAGQKITYTITYRNTTGKDADATITDKLPAHTKFVSAENGGKEEGGVVTWKKKVAKGDSFVARFTVQVDDDVNGEPIKNKAKANDGNNDYDTNEVVNPTPTRPEKEVFEGSTTTKIDGKVVKGGDELTYAITYRNTTGEDVETTITDKLPAHTKFVSADNGGTLSGGVVTWKANVKDGKSITVKFTVKVDKDVNGAPIDNQAKVNDGVNDYNTNETHNPTPTEPKKEVFTGGTTTNIDGVRVKPGQKLTYAITYKNTTGEERDVTITDKIPAHTTFVSADNGGKYEAGKVTWTNKVAKGETFKVKFTVKVDKDVNGQTLTNTARVNDGINDSDTNTVKNPTPKVPKKPNNPDNPHGPSTGDNSNIMLMLMLLLASGGALGSAAYMRRKRQ